MSDDPSTGMFSHPALLTHSLTVYDKMLEQAEPYDLEPDYHIWTGFLTHLFADLDLSVPYYTKVMNLLKEMDSVRQVRRGGSTTPSQWLMLQRPTEELYTYAADRLDLGVTKRREKSAVVDQKLRDLGLRISVLESQVEELYERQSEEMAEREYKAATEDES